MGTKSKNPDVGMVGRVAECWGCKHRVLFNGFEWHHIDTYGEPTCRMPGPRLAWRTAHKHSLTLARVSAKGTKLIFRCRRCHKERIYIRERVHLLVTNPKTKYTKRDRTN